jgi:methylthioribose-1-phosphate isomerase
MKIGEKYYHSVWFSDAEPEKIYVIDQEKLPFIFEIKELRSVEDIYNAIKNMTVRGAPAIGATAAFGMYLATLEIKEAEDSVEHLKKAAEYLISCRPTAVNLSWAVNKVLDNLSGITHHISIKETALRTAKEICENEINNCKKIGLTDWR